MTMNNYISNIFTKKKPVLSFEIFPPKRDTELESIDDTLKVLSELKPDFISVTFGAGGSVNNSQTVKLAKKIKEEYGIEPVVHLTCLNYTRSEIDHILDEMERENLCNVLALRGDRSSRMEPKEDFLHATDLIAHIHERGSFGISAACYPEGHPEAENRAEDIKHLIEKVDNGATHLISQLFFDNQYFYDFQKKAKELGIHVPIDAGIMPVLNVSQIAKMATLCGASLPPKFRRMMDCYCNRKEALFDAGMTYAMDQIVDLVASGVDGVHIYTMNNPEVARRICDGVKNLI